MKKSAIIVKGEWSRRNTIEFTATKGFYPIEDGKLGLFVKEEVIETGVTESIEEDTEKEYFNAKYNGLVERIDVRID